MSAKGKTPFSASKREYEDFLNEEKGYTNSRLDDEPLLETLTTDFARFKKTETFKNLCDVLEHKG